MAAPAKHWRELIQEKQAQRQEAIPKEWVLPLSPEELSKVDPFEYVTKCELLTAQELDITSSEVDTLLEKLAKAEWSAVQVTTAFAKRAIIAHQLVRPLCVSQHVGVPSMLDQLFDGNIHRSRVRTR